MFGGRNVHRRSSLSFWCSVHMCQPLSLPPSPTVARRCFVVRSHGHISLETSYDCLRGHPFPSPPLPSFLPSSDPTPPPSSSHPTPPEKSPLPSPGNARNCFHLFQSNGPAYPITPPVPSRCVYTNEGGERERERERERSRVGSYR